MDHNVHVRYVFTLYELDHICDHHNAFLVTRCCTSNSWRFLITLFNSTYSFTHVLIHSVWLQVWSGRKRIRYWCILLLYILCVLWVLFYTLHFLYLVLFVSLSDNSSLVANIICLLKPTWNKVYLISSYLILSYLLYAYIDVRWLVEICFIWKLRWDTAYWK